MWDCIICAHLVSVYRWYVHCQYFRHYFYAEGNPIPGAPTKDPIPDPSPQRVHLTSTAPREGGPSPDLIFPANRDQNFILPGCLSLNPLKGKGQGLTVLGTAVVADLGSGHNLPCHTGETGTV